MGPADQLHWAAAGEAAPTQKKAPIKTRRLKNADCEVDFFFMDCYG
jgi:hypothetical protein